jgi:hypothetical protein
VKHGLKKGVSVSGSHTARLRGGKLIVTREQAAARIVVHVKPTALRERATLRRHPGKHHTLRLSVADAAGTTTALTATS